MSTFKGRNSIQLNEATMMEIVQYWLDNKALNRDEQSPKVAGVALVRSSVNGEFFEISLTEQPT